MVKYFLAILFIDIIKMYEQKLKLMSMLYNWNSKSTGNRDSILLTLTSLAHCKMTGGPTIQASPLCNL